MIRLKSDGAVFVYLYLAALFITIHFAITQQLIISDQSWEYQLYDDSVLNFGWRYIENNIINSCPLVFLPPAGIQLITGWESEIVFKVWPCLIYSLTPGFVYLISRRYLDKIHSLLSCGMILLGFFFLGYPAVGRVGIAWGLLAGLMWAFFTGRVAWGVIFAVLLPFAHYGTACFGIAWLAMGSWGGNKKGFVPLIVLVSVFLLWDIAIARVPYYYIKGFTMHTLAGFPHPAWTLTGRGYEYLFYSPAAVFFTEIITKPFIALAVVVYTLQSNLKYRVLIVALVLASFVFMNVSIMLTVILGGGLVWFIARRPDLGTMRVMAAAYVMLLVSIFVPYVYTYYGASRTFATCMIVLSPVFVSGIKAFGEYIKTPRYLLPGMIVGMFGLMSSNLLSGATLSLLQAIDPFLMP